jgi:hypothetical protein
MTAGKSGTLLSGRHAASAFTERYPNAAATPLP